MKHISFSEYKVNLHKVNFHTTLSTSSGNSNGQTSCHGNMHLWTRLTAMRKPLRYRFTCVVCHNHHFCGVNCLVSRVRVSQQSLLYMSVSLSDPSSCSIRINCHTVSPVPRNTSIRLLMLVADETLRPSSLPLPKACMPHRGLLEHESAEQLVYRLGPISYQ